MSFTVFFTIVFLIPFLICLYHGIKELISMDYDFCDTDVQNWTAGVIVSGFILIVVCSWYHASREELYNVIYNQLKASSECTNIINYKDKEFTLGFSRFNNRVTLNNRDLEFTEYEDIKIKTTYDKKCDHVDYLLGVKKVKNPSTESDADISDLELETDEVSEEVEETEITVKTEEW